MLFLQLKMAIDRKRHITSWLMLAVFVPMLVLSSLHVHREVADFSVECVDCASHTHHAGHLTGGTLHVDTCVLCQFLTLSYLTLSVVAVLACQHLVTLIRVSSVRLLSYEGSGYKSTRAPPYAF